MKVKELMTTGLVTISPSATWKEAAELMAEKNISAVPVVDENEKILGILSEKDLFRSLFPSYKEVMETPHGYLDFEKMEERIEDASKRIVEEIMAKRLITAEPETPIFKVGALMVASGIHQVPVVENGRLVGMVKRGKIYNAILREHFGVSRNKD